MYFFTVDLPVKPHVKQYLMHNVFIKKPFTISQDHPAGICLMALLLPKRNMRRVNYGNTDTLSVNLGNCKHYNYKMWLPKHRARLFNSFIDDLMEQEFLNSIEIVLKYNLHAKVDQLIRDFEAKYQLQNTSLNFQTLKKRYYRKSKRLKNVA